MTSIAEDEPLLERADDGSQTNSGPSFGTRHEIAGLAFVGFFCSYCLRFNLSVAIVAMVKNRETPANWTGGVCTASNSSLNQSSIRQPGDFDWDEKSQGEILMSFFIGYLLSQLPGGLLAETYGAKHLFGFSVLFPAVMALITPVAVNHFGKMALITLRILQGLGEGVTFPAMSAMWGKWAPKFERSKLAGFTYAGTQLGVVMVLPISGWLCNSDFLGGWPSVFYVFGGLGCLWFLVWCTFAYNSPASHPRITLEERTHIETSAGIHTNTRTPLKDILRSKAVWGICAGHFANNWGLYTMLTTLPLYMKHILKFDINVNGVLSAVPYIFSWLCQIGAGPLADYLRKNHFLSTKNTRKLFTACGLMLPAGLLFGVGFYRGCNHIIIIVLLTLAVGFSGITNGGFFVNHIDISPNYSGTLMGISNCLATIPGIAGPLLVGILTVHNQTQEQWQIVFLICSGVYATGTFLYLLLAEGSEQPWNEPRGDIFSSRRLNP
ncbi:sialin-like [Mizuhopecten yessoensis]|uniref:sialin-like n=1 Tax=Mizuhopecten yessoensis TaxID=6573 RepID=UPI000B458907|nr:sialin-like [Mizuhopecten yessoensis]